MDRNRWADLVLEAARANEYAVGYFEAWDGYSLEAVQEKPTCGNGGAQTGRSGGQIQPRARSARKRFTRRSSSE